MSSLRPEELKRLEEIYASADVRVRLEPFPSGLRVFASTRVDAVAVAENLRSAVAERDPAAAILGPTRSGPYGSGAWCAEVRFDWRRF